jgi:DNA polymerase III epsilon subunit-like protein
MTWYTIDFETSKRGTNAEPCEVALIEIGSDLTTLAATELLSVLSLSSYTERFKPSHSIEPFVSAIHRIYDRDVRNCRPTSEFRLPADATGFIAHNASFDKAIAINHYKRIGEPMPPVKWLCTLQLARAIQSYTGITFAANNKLLTLFYHFYPHRLEEFKSKAHGAKADVEMCLLLLRALAPYAAPMTTVEELVEFLDEL